ncbi:MAG: ABC transporter permease [Thermoplasmata archaeon YP2-bin.285]|uniref:ABC transporter permease n=1 Tax=Candidatus Sysuiplasma superficiale TaxID=2823368 RepID=A0A8J7YRV3_9ARCH|nr:ABC transporter permease [Candidatus Sysuiplasma superficiale]
MQSSQNPLSEGWADRVKGVLRALRTRYSSRYLVRRIGSMIIVFIFVLILNFVLPHLMPGNFVLIYIEQLKRTHPGIPGNKLAGRIEAVYGLNIPIWDQFMLYLKNIFSLNPNFGPSFEYYPLSAWYVVLYALPWTLLLLGVSQAISWVAGIFLGIWLSFRKGKPVDKAIQPGFYFLNSTPGFWIGLVFIFLFAVEFHLFPPAGAYGLHETVTSILYHMVLPLTVIVLISLPSHTLVIRSVALEVLGSDYIQAMKAQGLSRRVITSRVMRNSFLPSLTNLALSIGYLIGGIFTIEYTFSYPGMGTIIANAILNDDYPVIEAALYLTTLVVLLANLAADLLYPIVDPRVSYAD